MEYDKLPFVIPIMAGAVAGLVYTGEEMSVRMRPTDLVKKTEAMRAAMTREQVVEFTELCDNECRAAFDAKAEWFMKCVRSKTNAGRDQLFHVWIPHWLCSYLNNPNVLRRRSAKENKK